MKPNRFLLWSIASFGLMTAHGMALEFRMWTSVDGSVEAEFVRADSEKVTVKDKAGREVSLEKKKLSTGDLKYVEEFAPKSNTPFGDKAVKPAQAANPAKVIKIDQKTFKPRTDKFEMKYQTFYILETPHFLILHAEKTDARDLGETAERVWHDMNFFHPTFAQKFQDRRMAVFLVETQEVWEDIGKWYSDMIKESPTIQNANDVADGMLAKWHGAAASAINMTSDITEKYAVLSHARVFRADEYKKGGGGGKIKGVYIPFRVHCLASDMMDMQTGGAKGDGLFAIETGHAYFKEIAITGRSETNMLREDGGTDHKVSSTGGFQGKNWADELKGMIRRDKVTPSLDKLFKTVDSSATTELNVLGYAFSRFLQSDTEKVVKYSRLVEQIDASNQIPTPDDLAKLYGYASSKAMEEAWITWMKSPDFK